MYGVIDIGSNTIRLNVYHLYQGGFKLILNNKVSAGLASYIEEGKLRKTGIDLAIAILSDFKYTCDALGIKNILCFATAPLRNISNSEYAHKTIEESTGLNIEILSGEDEGMLSYKGAIYDVQVSHGIAVDIGGGSTELVYFKDQEIKSNKSLEIGSLNTYNEDVAGILPNKYELKQIKARAKEEITRQVSLRPEEKLSMVGVGGTLRGCLKINNYIHDYDDNNKIISKKDLKVMVKLLSEDKNIAKSILLRTLPERIHTITPGLRILKTVASNFDIGDIHVSQFGVREGFLARHLENNNILNEDNNNILDINFLDDISSLERKINKYGKK